MAIFRDPLTNLISKTADIEVFGVKIKVSQSQLINLQEKDSLYRAEIVTLQKKLLAQANSLDKIDSLSNVLSQTNLDCNRMRTISQTINTQTENLTPNTIQAISRTNHLIDQEVLTVQ